MITEWQYVRLRGGRGPVHVMLSREESREAHTSVLAWVGGELRGLSRAPLLYFFYMHHRIRDAGSLTTVNISESASITTLLVRKAAHLILSQDSLGNTYSVFVNNRDEQLLPLQCARRA